MGEAASARRPSACTSGTWIHSAPSPAYLRPGVRDGAGRPATTWLGSRAQLPRRPTAPPRFAAISRRPRRRRSHRKAPKGAWGQASVFGARQGLLPGAPARGSLRARPSRSAGTNPPTGGPRRVRMRGLLRPEVTELRCLRAGSRELLSLSPVLVRTSLIVLASGVSLDNALTRAPGRRPSLPPPLTDSHSPSHLVLPEPRDSDLPNATRAWCACAGRSARNKTRRVRIHASSWLGANKEFVYKCVTSFSYI